ncbi:hypothetical protein IAT38_002504 [Cryptococcus sp. DSM 104549]
MKDKPRNGRKFPRFPGPAAQAWLRDERSTDLVHRDKQSMTRTCDREAKDPNATNTREHRPRASFGGVSGHAFSNPLIQPQYAAPAPVTGLGRSVSAQPVSSLRPQPPAHAQPQSPGYTDDQLHPSVVFPRSAGAVTPNSTLAMEGRSRLESTLTATSVGTGAGTAGGRSTLKGKKLLKKSGQPQGAGQEGAGSTLGRGTVKGTVGKRHWWNRRRSEVEGVAAVL